MSSSRKAPGRRKPSGRAPAGGSGRRPGSAARPRRSAPRAGSSAKAKSASGKGGRGPSATRTFVHRSGRETVRFKSVLPLLPLRDVVLFPGMMAPLLVGRPTSVAAVEHAVADDKLFAVLTQRDPQESDPGEGGLHEIGTVVRALQMLRAPDGTLKLLVEGICRFRRKALVTAGKFTAVQVEPAEEPVEKSAEIEALTRGVVQLFQEYVSLNRRLPDELAAAVENVHEPLHVAHAVSGHLVIELERRQSLLEATHAKAQLEQLTHLLGHELEILRLERKIEGEVRTRVSKGQKEFYLQEQLKAIRKELGETSGDEDDGAELRERVLKAGMPKEVEEKALSEVDRLRRMSSMSPEATVVRGYVETLVSLPWTKRTKDRVDLRKARGILDGDHYGLDKVKDRILEYLAVVRLVRRPRGSILCFVGPPGVGKTSLGRSVARALGREFVRVSLGGVRDEAEIRGHRRTYIGSMPGRIIQGIKRAGTKNPVFLLDEVDKLASDFRGDPSAALLEVLDPEQNRTFNDHYLDVDFDLSEVLFITTANVLPEIPPPLRDRMEILRLPGYLEHEKMGIARRFLVPKQLEEHGLKRADLSMSDEALRLLVTRYTREAGVRNLEREIAKVCRKVAAEKVGGKGAKRRSVGVKALEKMLGAPRFPARRVPAEDRVGAASGLAWTEWGGDVLPVEVAVMPGSGKILLTGRLGEVMRESARTALSYARRRAAALGLDPEFAGRIDLHIHIPEGATPKDGPSAGICIATAVLSALLRVPVRRDVAMTGELTLLGKVLPIGGLNEKVVAAALAGYRHVLVPRDNQPDWNEISPAARRDLEVTFVDHVDDVLRQAFVPSPTLDRILAAAEGAAQEGLPGFAH